MQPHSSVNPFRPGTPILDMHSKAAATIFGLFTSDHSTKSIIGYNLSEKLLEFHHGFCVTCAEVKNQLSLLVWLLLASIEILSKWAQIHIWPSFFNHKNIHELYIFMTIYLHVFLRKRIKYCIYEKKILFYEEKHWVFLIRSFQNFNEPLLVHKELR